MKPIKVKQGVPQKLDPDDNPTYEEWVSRVDKLLVAARGISLYDLVDCPTADWYVERIRPVRAANRALRYQEGED